MDRESLTEIEEAVKIMFEQSFKYKFFSKHFSQIPKDDIVNYHLVVPEKFRDNLGESAEVLEREHWVHFTKHAEEIMAFNKEHISDALLELGKRD